MWVGLVLGTAAAALSRRRAGHATSGTLIFDDEPPTSIIPLRLSGY
jgi:hypothetical protein